jgi:hypothetical protein
MNSTPDFSIDINGKLKIIMDAKNWLSESYDDAKYKMLGYLNNLYGTIGILFFHTKKQSFTYNPEIDKPSYPLNYHLEQALFQCIIPFQLTEKMLQIKMDALEKIINIILKNLFE